MIISPNGIFKNHWGRVTHICISKLKTSLVPIMACCLVWTNAGILSIRTSGTNFSEIFSDNRTLPFKKMHLKMSSAKWWYFCLGLNVLNRYGGLPGSLFIIVVPSMENNLMPGKVLSEVSYQFSNFNGAAIVVWEWISNFIPHFTMANIT